MDYRKLKSFEEINISALGRKAKIANNKLAKAVTEKTYRKDHPQMIRKLSDVETQRLEKAIRSLIIRLEKILL